MSYVGIIDFSDVTGNGTRHATGGSILGLLPKLSDQQLNVTQSINNTGNVRRSPRSVLNPPFNPMAHCRCLFPDVREVLDP